MAANRTGVPALSTEDIEGEIARLQTEGRRTEAWMTSRARKKMRELEERDRDLRLAFEAGYRMGADSNTWILLGLLLIPMAVAYPFM
jgi:hypothetical protein